MNAALKKDIAQYTALQLKYMTDWHRAKDYDGAKMFSPAQDKIINLPADWNRRWNDMMAATYAHSIANYSESGDDCTDHFGNALELKLAFIKARDLRIGALGRAIVTGPSSTSFGSTVNAKFRVYNGTDADHHTKDTALVLMSLEHNCFISGFILPGEKVKEIVHNENRNGIQREISLSAFIRDGYEFGSSAPHIGWENYYSALFDYLCAKEGRITGDEAEAALAKWISFADENNLKRL
jgi:hypothetical protein